jgi:hypothetical protein
MPRGIVHSVSPPWLCPVEEKLRHDRVRDQAAVLSALNVVACHELAEWPNSSSDRLTWIDIECRF